MDDKTRLRFRIYSVNILYRLKGRWIQLPYLLLASYWIHLVDLLTAQPYPCNSESVIRSRPTRSLGSNNAIKVTGIVIPKMPLLNK